MQRDSFWFELRADIVDCMLQSVPTSSLISTTTLPNRVRVATEETPGHFSAVGVYVDAGSRYERTWVPGESGVSHLLDRMAFKVSRRAQLCAATMAVFCSCKRRAR